ncbi:MAG: helix-turn-helix transcriptional regulator [Clostridia bacterium]|nr:helix-turn-helix transcriptional regulator [Clostridia bacterium]
MVISSDLLRGYTDAIILRCLRNGDGYGYQISKEVSALSDGRLELKEATLYTAFRRMESSGYIRSYWGDENIGARRRYYSLTDEGRNKLEEETKAWAETRNVMNKLLEGDTEK